MTIIYSCLNLISWLTWLIVSREMSPLIGIIGGSGRMGRWFKRLFEHEGYEVLISDLHTPLTNKDLAIRCDVLILSVPMPVFEDVLKEIGPLISEKKGVIDLCSLKKFQTKAMLDLTKCEVVAAHPLFGPGEKDLCGQKVVLWPARGKRWFSWFKQFVENAGGKPVIISPEEHDQAMAIIQVINHFMLLALGKLIDDSGIPLEKIKALATPAFVRQLDILARFADQDPYLYGAIQFDNPSGGEMRNRYIDIAKKLNEIAQKQDLESFVTIFKEVQALGRKIKNDKVTF